MIASIGTTAANGNWSRYGGGCVDEVRGTWTIAVADSSSFAGWQSATVWLSLYEGASCATNDLDGWMTQSFWLPPNTTTTKKFRVWNTDEGGDYIDFTFVLKHNITG